MKEKKLHIIWAVIAVVALGGGYFWGNSVGADAASGAAAHGGGPFAGGNRGSFTGPRGSVGGGITTGQVTAIDSQSITLQLPNGNSQNVFYSGTTQVIVPQPTSISAVKPGDMIIVSGSTDSSGNLTATMIQVRNGSSTFGGSGRGGSGVAGTGTSATGSGTASQ